jgi:transcriptional regulator with XRE-family HTH domain
MGNAVPSVRENYSAQFATTFRGLLKWSPKTQGKTTYKMLAEHLGVKQQSVSLWANGATMPDAKHIAPIAVYFGVSCDYLLGLTDVQKPDVTAQAVSERYGLNEAALTVLSGESLFSDNVRYYQESVNLLLSTEIGLLFLKFLARYLFAKIDGAISEYFNVVMPWDVSDSTGEGRIIPTSSVSPEEVGREVLFNTAVNALRELEKGLRRERAAAGK